MGAAVIHRSDPALDVDLVTDVAEVGGVFEGHLTRKPQLDDSQEAGKHRLQGVRLELRYETEGRGDTDARTVTTQRFQVDEWGQASVGFQIQVPPLGPISYDGRLIRVRWELIAIAMVKLAIDRRLSLPVLVVPRNGGGLYDRPHPLLSRVPPPPLPPVDTPGPAARPDGHDSPFEPPAPGPQPFAPGSPHEPPTPGVPYQPQPRDGWDGPSEGPTGRS